MKIVRTTIQRIIKINPIKNLTKVLAPHKKLTALLFIAVAAISLTFALLPTAQASQKPISVKVDGILIDFPDSKPFVENGRVLVPVRFVSEALGAEVAWTDNKEGGKVTEIFKDDKRIALVTGRSYAVVNNAEVDGALADIRVDLDAAVCVSGGRTFVPLRFVSEMLGAGVAWDGINRMAMIRSDGTVEAIPTPTPLPNITAENVDEVIAAMPEEERKAAYEKAVADGLMVKEEPKLDPRLTLTESGKRDWAKILANPFVYYHKPNTRATYGKSTVLLAWDSDPLQGVEIQLAYDLRDYERGLKEARYVLLQGLDEETVDKAIEVATRKKNFNDYRDAVIEEDIPNKANTKFVTVESASNDIYTSFIIWNLSLDDVNGKK